MKRPSSTGRSAIVLGLAMVLLPLAPATAHADVPTLQAPFSQGRVWTEVVATSGDDVLVFAGGSYLLTSDGGSTWQPAAVRFDDKFILDTVSSGKAVFTDYLNHIAVLDLATNQKTEYAMPVEVGSVISATDKVAITKEIGYLAVDLQTGAATQLQPDFESGTPEYADDYWTERTVIASPAGGVRVDYYVDNEFYPVGVDIDPMPFDGTHGGGSFRAMGYLPYIGIAGGRVEYVKQDYDKVYVCSRLLTGTGGASCTNVITLGKPVKWVGADRSGDAIRLELNGAEYLWEHAALRKVTYSGTSAVFEGLGDSTRPLVRVQKGSAGGTYRVATDGSTSASTSKVFDDLVVPVAPSGLDLNAGQLTGRDERPGRPAWSRPLAANSIGSEAVLASGASQVLTTAGRTVVNGSTGLSFYDQGALQSTTAAVGLLAEASGPYVLTANRDATSLRTRTGSVSATRPMAIFGSTYVSLNYRQPDLQPIGKVIDTATQRTLAVIDPTDRMYRWIPERTTIWGDWVTFDLEQYGTNRWGEQESDTQVYNYVTGEWVGTYNYGTVAAMGDGVAVMWNWATHDYSLWHFVDHAVTDLGQDVIAPTLDDANHLAYADGDGLVVTTVPSMGTSAPRLLGAVAATNFNPNAGAWKPEFDATKPLAAGTLELTKVGDSVPSRILPVPASADGSIRGVSWDGRDDERQWLPDGVYTWTLHAVDATNPAKALAGIDGTSAASGTVTLKTANLGTVTTVTPKVSDTTPTVDQTLTAVTGAWKPTMVLFGYQWYRDSTAIPGATAASYKALPSDAGHTLKVKVTGSCPGTDDYCRGYASASKTSASTSKVSKATVTPAAAPVLASAAPVVDSELMSTLVPWGPEPVAVTYQWYKVNAKGTSSAISGAKLSTFTPTGAEVGYKLKLKATGTKAGYTTKSLYSILTGKVAKASFASVDNPTITGSVKLGMPLTAVPGATDRAVKASFQWYRGSTKISGATAVSYKTTSSDLGKQLKVLVTYARSGYVSVSRYSALTAAIEPGLVPLTPKLDDTTPAVGQVLRITDATGIGAWTPADVVPAYQWYRDSSAIGGATGATYEVQAGDVGKAIKVKVTGSKDGYVSVAKTSAASSDVVRGVFTVKPAPIIDGKVDNTAKVGGMLTANPGDGWVPTPASFTYSWYRSGTAISGKTASTYTLVAADLGKTISVKVTAVRSGFTSASATSTATLPILAA